MPDCMTACLPASSPARSALVELSSQHLNLRPASLQFRKSLGTPRSVIRPNARPSSSHAPSAHPLSSSSASPSASPGPSSVPTLGPSSIPNPSSIPSPVPTPGTSASSSPSYADMPSLGPWRSPAPSASRSSGSRLSPVPTHGPSASPSLFILVLNEVEAANLRRELNNPHLLPGCLEVEGDEDGFVPV